MSRLPWLLLAFSGACAAPAVAPPETPPPPVSSASASASASVAAAEPGPPPTPLPVAAPPGLLLEAKSKPLEATAKELGKLTGLPLDSLLKTLGPAALRTDAGLGAVVLVGESASEELTPPLHAAFSVPIHSERAFSEAVSRDRGLWRPRGVGFVMSQGPAGEIFCKTAVALGDAPLRVVCGPTEEQVAKVTPYLTRGLPSADLGPGDLRINIHFSALKPRLSSPLNQLKEQQGDLLLGGGSMLLGGLVDPALLSAPAALIDEGTRLIDAQEGASVGVNIDGGSRSVELSGVWKFSKNESWFVRLATSHPERGAAPEVFWRLPQESEVALFGRGVDGEMQDEPRRVTRKVTGFLLEHSGIADADRRALDDAMATLPRGDTPWALGAGGEGAGAWWLLGSEGDAGLFPTWLRRSGQALQRMVAFGKQNGGQSWKDAAVGLKVEQGPAGFPAGSVLIEAGATLSSGLLSDLLPTGVIQTGAAKWVLVAAPDGKGRSWLGVASDRAVLKTRMRQATARGDGKDRIGAEQGLDALKSGKHGFGGRILVGSAIGNALAKARWLKEEDGKIRVPIVLTGGVSPEKIEARAVIPGTLLSGGLRGALLGKP